MSLLAALGPRFAASPENLATEALNYVVARAPECRSGLIAWAGTHHGWVAPWADRGTEMAVVTQHTVDDGGIPDLVAIDTGQALRVMIEAKFDAGLTGNQPVDYLSHLDEDGVLVFLVPERRRDYLHAEVLRRLEAADLMVERASDHLAVVGGRAVTTQTWRDLLTRLALVADESSAPGLLEDIRQLRGLTDRMNAQTFVPLTSEDLTGPAPHVLRRIAVVHENLWQWIRSRDEFDVTGMRPAGNWHDVIEHVLPVRRLRLHPPAGPRTVGDGGADSLVPPVLGKRAAGTQRGAAHTDPYAPRPGVLGPR
jgi:hypothetical protein